MERVDALELEPIVVDVARICAPVNHDAMANPKLHVTIGDARELLLTSDARYDVIASEPSNPFRAGIASMFTAEYYQAARHRLTPDGVFAQWIQAYEIDTSTLRTIYTTLGSVFSYIETWQTSHGDLILVAMTHPAVYSAATLQAQLQQQPLRSAVINTWRAADINGVPAHFIANDSFARGFIASSPIEINTDDRNVVEFGLARSVGKVAGTLVSDIRGVAHASGTWRPPLDDDRAVSWTAVDTAWANFNGWDAQSKATIAAGNAPPEEQARRAALVQYFEAGDLAATRNLWRGQTEPPRDPSELVLAADVETQATTDAAMPLIERLRTFQPAEADVMLAQLRMRQSRFDDAAAALEAALNRLHDDPWPVLAMKQRALQLADLIGRQNPALARRLYAAVGKPFAVETLPTDRLLAALNLSTRADFATMCRAPLDALEPHLVWNLSFLRLRHECYRVTNDARLNAAARDISDFLAHEPQPVAVQ